MQLVIFICQHRVLSENSNKLITIEDGMHCAEQNRFLEEEKVSDFVLA